MEATNPLRRERIKIGRLKYAIKHTYNTDKKKKSQIRSI